MTHLEIALTVVQQLRDEGYNVVIAGGAARDLLHGRDPKDFDLVMMDDLDIDEALACLDRGRICNVEPFGNGSSMAHCEDAKLDWVIKFSVPAGENLFGPHVQFDLIQHKTHPETPEEVVRCFDCNINQAWLVHDSDMDRLEYPAPIPNLRTITRPVGDVLRHVATVAVLDDYPMDNGGIAKALPLCDYPRARMTYLSSKYPQYIWPTDAELQSHPNYHKG